MRFIHKAVTASTNVDAHALALAGTVGPLWISASQQEQGRGRLGRAWVSKPGNLYASGLYPAGPDLGATARLSFAAALAIYDTVKTYAPDADLSLKWPNDVLVGAAKIAGILLETGSVGGANYVIIGIGLNLEHHPETTRYPATHLLAHIPKASLDSSEPLYTGPEAVLAVLVARFNHWRDVHESNGFAPLQAAWMQKAHGLGRMITVDGQAVRFIGLGQNGELQVERDNGTIETVFAGDVAFTDKRANNAASD